MHAMALGNKTHKQCFFETKSCRSACLSSTSTEAACFKLIFTEFAYSVKKVLNRVGSFEVMRTVQAQAENLSVHFIIRSI